MTKEVEQEIEETLKSAVSGHRRKPPKTDTKSTSRSAGTKKANHRKMHKLLKHR